MNRHYLVAASLMLVACSGGAPTTLHSDSSVPAPTRQDQDEPGPKADVPPPAATPPEPSASAPPPAPPPAVPSADDAWGVAATARAQSWVDQHVPFSSDPIFAGYRTDCGGLVSYAWNLSAPGNTPSTFAGGAHDDGASTIITWNDLRPGDALTHPGSNSHMMLFAGWDDAAHTSFHAYAEVTSGTFATYTQHTLTEVFRNVGTIGAIFTPIRARARAVSTLPAPTLLPMPDWTCSQSDYQGTQIWTCMNGARYKCISGMPVEQECIDSCVSQPLGVDDYCR